MGKFIYQITNLYFAEIFPRKQMSNPGSAGGQDSELFEQEETNEPISSSFKTNTQVDISVLQGHILPTENIIKFTIFRYVLGTLSMLEIWSITTFCVGALSGKLETFDLSSGSFSIPLSLWDLYQIYVLYSALTYKNLQKLDKGIRLVKCFMVLVPMFGVILFYYTMYIVKQDRTGDVSIVKQGLAMGLTITVVEILLYLVYLLPAKKLRGLMVPKENVIEMSYEKV